MVHLTDIVVNTIVDKTKATVVRDHRSRYEAWKFWPLYNLVEVCIYFLMPKYKAQGYRPSVLATAAIVNTLITIN